MARIRKGIDLLRKTNGPVDLFKLKKGNIGLVVFACWVRPNYPEPFTLAMESVERIWQLAERSRGRLKIIRHRDDIDLDKVNILIGVEGGHIFEKNLFMVDALFRAGVRVFTLTWENTNSLAHSAVNNDRKGLTKKGRSFVKEIEGLGGIVDLSHASTRTVLDCCNVVSRPIIASHSCLRSLNPMMRNISDRALSAIAATKGIVGINLCRRHLGNSEFSDQVEYLLGNFGSRILAFGSDFDGIKDPIIADYSKVPQLLQDLIEVGIRPQAVEALAFRNCLRVIKRCVS